jgi:hypothetical protein
VLEPVLQLTPPLSEADRQELESSFASG